MEREHGSGQRRVLIYNVFEKLNTEHINKMEGKVMGRNMTVPALHLSVFLGDWGVGRLVVHVIMAN